MAGTARFVIVGASLAGAKAAETLRQDGFEGEIVLVGEESVRPYERPPLSKDYLQGKAPFEKAFVHDASFYADHGIDLRLSSTVSALDANARTITLSTGERLGFDRALLATGAMPRRLSVPGAELEGVHYLRHLADADELKELFGRVGRIVVLGGGWIGSEVAASARQLGVEVALVEAGSLPLERVLGPELGRFYKDVHEEHGVETHFGSSVEALIGATRFEAVALANGTTVAGDAVVVGIGATPRIELAEQGGLGIENGIVTDEYLATSAPYIYAAGDVANAWHPVFDERIRLEHWSSALNQGPAAAKNMLGEHVAYDRIPYFYSDQYDIGMEYAGHARTWDEVVFRGDPADKAFIAFWLHNGRVVAGMNVNIWDVSSTIADLVRSRSAIDKNKLVDVDVALEDLLE